VKREHAASAAPLCAFERELVGLARHNLDLTGKQLLQGQCGGLDAADIGAGEFAGMAGIGDHQHTGFVLLDERFHHILELAHVERPHDVVGSR